MANTVIQLKYSTVTATPTSLNVAEPAYSYTSNTLFIGSPAGTGAIAIGGKFYLDQQQAIYDFANAAFNTANNAGSGAFNQASFAHANAAFHQANAAYGQANTNATNITVIQGVNTTQNTNITTAQTKADNAFHQANAAYAQANTNTSDITVIQGVNLTQNTNTTNAQNSASAAFIRANNSLSANAGGTVTGNVTILGNVAISGNLIVTGNTFSLSVGTIVANDSLIILGEGNYSSDTVDIGFAGHYNDGTNAHSGLIRDVGTKEWYLFKNYVPEIGANNNVIITDPTFTVDTLNANLKSQLITVNDQNLQTYVNNAYNQANTAVTNAATAQTKADNAFHQANAAYAQANTNASAITVLQAVNVTQNTSITDLQAVNLTQNTNITNAQNKADSAFIQANAAFSLANGTAGVANTDYTTINIAAGNYGIVTGGYAYVPGFKLEANGRISQANATLLQVDTSAITSGIFSVPRGGTGAGSFTTNGVLLGQGTSAFTTASSSTEGHVLTINNAGVPTFAHLSGGTF